MLGSELRRGRQRCVGGRGHGLRRRRRQRCVGRLGHARRGRSGRRWTHRRPARTGTGRGSGSAGGCSAGGSPASPRRLIVGLGDERDVQLVRMLRIGEEPARLNRPRRADLARTQARVQRGDLGDQVPRADVGGTDRLAVDRNDVDRLSVHRIGDRLHVAQHDRVVADRVLEHRHEPRIDAPGGEQGLGGRWHRQARVGQQLADLGRAHAAARCRGTGSRQHGACTTARGGSRTRSSGGGADRPRCPSGAWRLDRRAPAAGRTGGFHDARAGAGRSSRCAGWGRAGGLSGTSASWRCGCRGPSGARRSRRRVSGPSGSTRATRSAGAARAATATARLSRRANRASATAGACRSRRAGRTPAAACRSASARSTTTGAARRGPGGRAATTPGAGSGRRRGAR